MSILTICFQAVNRSMRMSDGLSSWGAVFFLICMSVVLSNCRHRRRPRRPLVPAYGHNNDPFSYSLTSLIVNRPRLTKEALREMVEPARDSVRLTESKRDIADTS